MKNRARALTVLIAVLLAGFVLGIAGLHFWQQRTLRYGNLSTSSIVTGHPDRLVQQLQLTADQQRQLKTILEDSRNQINAASLENEQRLQDVRIRTNEKIIAILNEDQKKNFQQFLIEGDRHNAPAGRWNNHGRRDQQH
jgi:hypothetical protein